MARLCTLLVHPVDLTLCVFESISTGEENELEANGNEQRGDVLQCFE